MCHVNLSLKPLTLLIKAPPFYFKYDIWVLFLHNSYGTPELPDCETLVGQIEWKT